MDVWKDATLGNCHVSEKLVQFLVIADGELKVARDDTRLFVITSSITSELKNFGSEVFKDSGKIDGCTLRTCQNIKMLREDTSYRHRRAERSFLSSKDGGHGQRGTQDPLWMSG